MEESKYPECEKMKEISDQSQAIGEFLEWLGDTKKVGFYQQDEDGELYMYAYSTERLLAEFFNINLSIVEEEKRQMLVDMRELNSK